MVRSKSGIAAGSAMRTTREFEPPVRWKAGPMASMSPQISLSNPPPCERKIPTMSHSLRWTVIFAPRSRPWMRSAIRSPTMTS